MADDARDLVTRAAELAADSRAELGKCDFASEGAAAEATAIWVTLDRCVSDLMELARSL